MSAIRFTPEAMMHSAGGGNRARRREIARRNGRKGGLVSGVRRRQLARGRCPARHRTRQTALALVHKHRQLSDDRVRKAYEREYPRPERASAAVSWEKGRETFVAVHKVLWRLYRAKGQHCATTKPQLAQALRALGLERTPRTVRRLMVKFECLGLGVLVHDRRGGARPGNKDRLVLEMRTPRRLACHPAPSGQQKAALRAELSAAAPRKEHEIRNGDAPSPPPSAADDDTGRHSAPDQPVTEETELEGRIRFAEMKVEAGFATGPARAQLRYLEGELRRLRQARESSASDPAPLEG